MRRKYFIHKFIRYFFIFTLPVIIMAAVLSAYSYVRIKKDTDLKVERTFQIGTELKVAAIASGMTFQGLIPSLTYVKVPMFELAVNIVRDTCRLICDGVSVSELRREKYLAPLIIGKSTMKYKTSEEKDL